MVEEDPIKRKDNNAEIDIILEEKILRTPIRKTKMKTPVNRKKFDLNAVYGQ